ncbi:hypothetical protein, partial [Paraburkholderia humisilvae]
ALRMIPEPMSLANYLLPRQRVSSMSFITDTRRRRMAQERMVQLAFIQAPDETGQDYLRDARLAARDIRSAGGTSIMPALT